MMSVWSRCVIAGLFAVGGVGVLGVADVDAQTTNRWTNTFSSVWQAASNWSAGVPTNSNALVLITNTTTKTVTINSLTPAANLTISNLTVSGRAGTVNTLQLTNAPAATLRVIRSLSVTNGGALVVTNSALLVQGLGGGGWFVDGLATLRSGSIIVSNATAFIGNVGAGTLTVSGGTNILASLLTVGSSASANGNVWVTGGQLMATNGTATIGSSGVGQMTVSNGVVVLRNLTAGAAASGRGTLTVMGGTSIITSNLILGTFACTATGAVVIAGGGVFVTNATTSAVCDVRSGSVTLNSGALTIDNLILTNACGHFIVSGGALSITTTNFDPNLSAVGDGISNWWKLQYGFDLFDPTVAGADPDGDGFTTLQEFQGGSDPTDPTSTPNNNYWINSAGGKWETTANWSRGQPSSTQPYLFITNANTKTVLVDSTTSGSFSSTMTISNLFLSGVGNAVNSLVLSNAGKMVEFEILNGLSIGGGGSMSITNSVLLVDGLSGGGCFNDGSITVLNAGTVTLSGIISNITAIGNDTNGSMAIKGGLVTASDLAVGETDQGTLTVTGGALTLYSTATSILFVGDFGGSTGTVWLTGGSVTLNNDAMFIGFEGVGQMTISNMTVPAADVYVGEVCTGALTVVAGTLNMAFNLEIGDFEGGVGTVLLTGGGQLLVPNDSTTIGGDGIGQLIVSNGTASINDVTVGNFGAGTLTLSGGTVTLAAGQLANLNLADFPGATGVVQVTAGQLLANVVTTTIGNSGVGQMLINGGTVSSRDVWVGNFFGSSGTLTVAGGTNTLSSFLRVGVNPGAIGAVSVTGGQLSVLNDSTIIGSNGIGQVTVSNGTARLRDLIIASGVGAQGTLTVAGGTTLLSTAFSVGQATTSVGIVSMTGGQLVVTNGPTIIASNGVGRVTIANGTMLARDVTIGNNTGSQGTLTISGGTNTLSSALTAGKAASATGTIWITNGQLLATNSPTIIGSNGIGRVTISNGTVRVRSLALGNGAGSAGSLTIAGGTTTVFSNIVVGDCPLGIVGTVLMSGGNLYVTNAAGTAALIIRNGNFTQTGGTLKFDKLVLTNSCGATFTRTGGTLLLDPNLDADSDGLPNGWEQQYGLDPLKVNGTGDPDGDGLNNLGEFLAGTDPINNASVFRITSITKTANNLRVTWTMGSGKTNALQRATGTTGGSYNTNSFVSIFTVTNTVGNVTNFLDVGVLTNTPARYYRIRLVP